MISQAYIDQWGADVNRESSRSETGGNKRSLYKTFKHNFEVETYCISVYYRSHRGASSNLEVVEPLLRLKLVGIEAFVSMKESVFLVRT